MKIANAIIGFLLIVSAPLLWHFAALPWGWAVVIGVIGFLVIPENHND